MKDISAILIHYSDQAALSKALASLEPVCSRLNAVIVFQQSEIASKQVPDVGWSDWILSVPIENQDEGEIVRETINMIDTAYVLLLSGTDYLSASITPHSLQLTGDKVILETFAYNWGNPIRKPLLVRTPFLKQHPLLLSSELPFKDALLPAWLSTVQSYRKVSQENLVKQTRKTSSKNTIKRQKFIKKYQLEKADTDHPSLSIIMAAYNMEKYVETAVTSCLMQNEQAEQLLIMDDGSTDNTRQRLKRYSDNPRVQVFSKKNGGKARALNAVLPHVTSGFVLELDADDWLDPDAVSVIKKQLADLSADGSVLYGNLRKWKQLKDDVQYKGLAKGTSIAGRKDLLSYRFPLGPRVYRTSSLKKEGGFPVIDFADGRLYEDVSVLNRLLKKGAFQYWDFTVYNVREHKESITKQNLASWHDFLKSLE
ncbi:Glycosyl transferase family 2 [Lentibacillus persicus]|uniref:Glycosyl transferase family 2 n=1 Tax=Lentibacillus persicus TaxID=640948 RepID=A0A1I1YAH8_9BACI|nr:glycosyltransferase family 2 protein [Lentibacillus persicus]SFE16556.1 Glycosyl transferase family 2 [Lentibacillus persicus]